MPTLLGQLIDDQRPFPHLVGQFMSLVLTQKRAIRQEAVEAVRFALPESELSQLGLTSPRACVAGKVVSSNYLTHVECDCSPVSMQTKKLLEAKFERDPEAIPQRLEGIEAKKFFIVQFCPFERAFVFAWPRKYADEAAEMAMVAVKLIMCVQSSNPKYSSRIANELKLRKEGRELMQDELFERVRRQKEPLRMDLDHDAVSLQVNIDDKPFIFIFNS